MNSHRRIRIDSELIELTSPRVKRLQKIAVSRHGVVSSQKDEATEAGAQILADGGNAIDAAVATALALGVCEPAASGLGGQTFLIIYLAKTGKTFILDGSSTAPHRAIPGTISKEERKRGYKAATVPTTPRTLAYALSRYGTLSWEQVLQPAIRIAEDGFVVTDLYNSLVKRELKDLRNNTASLYFLKKGKYTFRVGDKVKQPVLAKTLKRLARNGVKSFYRGKIARLIHQDMVRNGGLIRLDDLAQVRPPVERRPVACWFEGLRVMTMPPPGAGRTLIEMLNIFSHLPKKYRKLDSPESALILSRVMHQTYRDRRDRVYEPNYYPQVSKRRMLSPEYAKKVARRIKTGGETTHLSVMDRYGNVVGLTQSIERVFGSCCCTEELGFLYNNYLMAFEHEDIAHPYFLHPNAVPWASVAPTIVFKGRRPWLVIGSPGSERITASIFQVLLRLQRHPPYEAVDAPRLYCSIDGIVSMEASRMRDDIPPYLEENGFKVDFRDPYSFYLGCVQLVMREGETFTGVADPRRDGSARGFRK